MISAAQARSTSSAAPRQFFAQQAVVVPVAVIELDEPHAALGQPSGEQAVDGERPVARLAAVELASVFGVFGSQVHQVGHAGLHLEGHFILGDARGDLGVVDERVVLAVERVDGRHVGPCCRASPPPDC